jgi:hypothetical protein
MSWGAQNRSKDAKTPSAGRAMSRKSKLELCGIQPYHTKRTKKCGLRTNCNAVLKELGPKNLNRVVARSSHKRLEPQTSEP